MQNTVEDSLTDTRLSLMKHFSNQTTHFHTKLTTRYQRVICALDIVVFQSVWQNRQLY